MNDTLNLHGHTLRLPVLPAGATYLMQKLSDDEISFEDLARVIEQFASISARLIALANSAWSGSTKEVTSVEEACTRLGLNVVRSTSIALAISSPFNAARCPAFDPIRYWQDSMLVAEAAYGLSDSQPLPPELCSQTMRTLGLLHNLGLLWMADSMPQETQAALLLAAEQEISVSQALIQRCGFDYTLAADALCRAWELPDTLTLVLGNFSQRNYQGPMHEGCHVLNLAKQLNTVVHQQHPEQLQHLSQTEHIDDVSALRAEYRRLERLQPQIESLASMLF